jgi:hypothetical protein
MIVCGAPGSGGVRRRPSRRSRAARRAPVAAMAVRRPEHWLERSPAGSNAEERRAPLRATTGGRPATLISRPCSASARSPRARPRRACSLRMPARTSAGRPDLRPDATAAGAPLALPLYARRRRLDLGDRDQPRSPLRPHARDCRHDAAVDRRQADAERLRCLLACVDELLYPVRESEALVSVLAYAGPAPRRHTPRVGQRARRLGSTTPGYRREPRRHRDRSGAPPVENRSATGGGHGRLMARARGAEGDRGERNEGRSRIRRPSRKRGAGAERLTGKRLAPRAGPPGYSPSRPSRLSFTQDSMS